MGNREGPAFRRIHGTGGAFLALAILSPSCVSREDEIKAIANGVRGGIGAVHGHFRSKATQICDEAPKAETSIVPPLDKTCSRGCRCAAGPASNSDATYDCNLWDTPEWKRIRFLGRYATDGKVNPIVYFHHQASWHRTEQGCRLEITVYGDLDEDGVYSTYATTFETTPDGAVGHWPDETLLWE